MKTALLSICLLASMAFKIPNNSTTISSNLNQQIDSCHFNGIQLYGKVQFVEYESNADITVQIVNSFPDLKVQFVNSYPNDCGEWQIVESYGDIKVYVTESFPDIKIQPVTSFPGVSN
ncbi:hypothetical protein [Aquimarina addita]